MERHKKVNTLSESHQKKKTAEGGKSLHVNKHRSKFTKGFVVIKLQWSPYFSFHFEDEKIVSAQRREEKQS